MLTITVGKRTLFVYATCVTGLLIATLATGAAPNRPVFDQITVHRVNIVEPDGTLRMVISNKADLPGVIIKGKEQPPVDRPQAGMIFYNDEGTENGGLIFGGRKDGSGKVLDSGGSLSFDKYGANQIVQLAGVDDSNDQFAGLAVSDANPRIWVGRTGSGDATIALRDGAGRKRIILSAPADGTPTISFLDADGQVVQKLAPVAR